MSARTLVCIAAALLAAQSPRDTFLIQVVDESTGRGVPLVELKTIDNVRYYTDSAGLIAFREPALMGRRVYFYIHSDGYEYPKDGFDYRGRKFDVKAGGSAVVKLKRIDIAERLYRVTGAGIYRDTVLAGRKAPIGQPLLNAKVTGCDGVQTAIYRGKLFWFWGDTNGIDYPLGNFAATGATSDLPGDPAAGVDLHYFQRKDGFVQSMFDIPGDGPKWLSGLMVLPDHSGRDRLLAGFIRVRQDMATVEAGLTAYNDDAQVFRKLVNFPADTKVRPDGRPFRVRVRGRDYYYMFSLLTLPWIRVPATWDQVQHLENYEVFTCAGAVCGWKQNAAPMLWTDQKQLIAAGRLKPAEGMWQVRDVDTGQPIEARMGTVYWNAYRKRWIAILQRPGNAVYFAEADTPAGPWVYAKKVVEFEHYTYYWPAQHPYFDQNGGRTIYFEGTYTAAFSNAPFETPLYDYNQLMYRLNLDDPRLRLPAPVYKLKSGKLGMREAIRDWAEVDSIAFFALPGDTAYTKQWPNPYAMLPIDADAPLQP